MKSERQCIKLPTIKTIVLVMMLGVLLIQLVGCSGTSSNPVPSSSSANSNGSISAIESEAQSTAIDAWISLLNARQGTPNDHLYTTVLDMDPVSVRQALIKGNTLSVTWEEYGRAFNRGTKGEVQIKNFKSEVRSSIYVLSEADKANGITWKGTVRFPCIMRYRAVWWAHSSLSADSIPFPPDNAPFSPWEDSDLLYGVRADLIKQNGEWHTTISSRYQDGDWSDEYSNSIINPLPLAVGSDVMAVSFTEPHPYIIYYLDLATPTPTPTTSGSSPLTSTSSYNRTAACNYAQRYGTKVCSDGYFWDVNGSCQPKASGSDISNLLGKDCAHFVSCCIGLETYDQGGGIHFPAEYASYGKPNALNLVNWLVDQGYATDVSSVNQLEQGDVIYYAWSSTANDHHVALYLGDGNVASHTYSTNSAPWQLERQAYQYRFIHILHG